MLNGTDTRTYVEIGVEIGSLILISVLGIPGNILVLAAILVHKKIRTVANGFVFNLAIADLLVCSLVVPMLIPSRLYRKWLFGDGVCVLQGFLNFIGIYASLFFLAAVALNRLVVIRFPSRYQGIFTSRTTPAMFFVLWVMSVMCALPPVIGWGRYTFDHVRDNCMFDRKAAPFYSFFMAGFGILFPMVISATSYVWVWAIFVCNRKKLRELSNTGNSEGFSKEEVRLTKNLFLIWVVFFICWAPTNIMLFTDPRGEISRPYYMAGIWFSLANSCVNPLLYGLSNKHFREGYKKIFSRCLKFCKKNVVHVEVESTVVHSERRNRTTVHSITNRHSTLGGNTTQTNASSGESCTTCRTH